MKNVVRALLTCSVLAVTAAAHADTLSNTSVTGSITGPGGYTTNVFTTPGTTTVGSNVEFTTSGATSSGGTGAIPYVYSVDFSDTGLLFSVTCSGKSCGAVSLGGSFTATFTDSAFAGGSFADGLANGTQSISGFTYSLNGSTLTITGDLGKTGNNGVNFTPAATPEPSSLALLGTGILGMAGLVRRRFNK